MILTIEETEIENTEEEKKPLIIPLIKPLHNNNENNLNDDINRIVQTSYAVSEVKVKEETKTVEQLAAEELLGLNASVTTKIESAIMIKFRKGNKKTSKGLE